MANKEKFKMEKKGPSIESRQEMCVIINYVFFTPLESPAIYGGDDIGLYFIPYRKCGVKASSFLTGFNWGRR
jgi:hypothetical protein